MQRFLKLKSSYKPLHFSCCINFGFSSSKNPYDILEINRNSTLQEAKEAYRKLSKLYHPDINKTPGATKKFQEISEAMTKIKSDNQQGKTATSDAQKQKKKEERNYTYSKYGQSDQKENKNTSDSEEKQSSSGSSKYDDESKKNEDYKKYREDREKDEEYQEYLRTKDMNQEELIYYRIFGRTFKEDPKFFYKTENAHLRRRYEEELEMLKKERAKHEKKSENQENTYQDEEEAQRNEEENKQKSGNYNNNSYRSPDMSSFDTSQKLIFFGACGFLAVSLYFIFVQEKKKKNLSPSDRPMSNLELETLRLKHIQKEKEKEDKKLQEFNESLAPMKKYPKKNPRAIDMLIDYTIYPDIKIYQSASPKEKDKSKKEDEIGLISNVRVNTLISISIECERILKYTYVKVDDVLDSLKEFGHYEPPSITTTFLGLLTFKIRPKPIIAENLQEHIKLGEKHISLFDLFFRYTTPILLANPDYYEFPVTHDAMRPEFHSGIGPIWVGNVRINHFKMNPYFITKPVKNISRDAVSPPGDSPNLYVMRAGANSVYQIRKQGEAL